MYYIDLDFIKYVKSEVMEDIIRSHIFRYLYNNL